MNRRQSVKILLSKQDRVDYITREEGVVQGANRILSSNTAERTYAITLMD